MGKMEDQQIIGSAVQKKMSVQYEVGQNNNNGGMGELKTSIKRIFDSITENELNKVARKMQKTVLW